MQFLFILIIFFISPRGNSTSIATCSMDIKVVNSKQEKNCGKSVEFYCDNMAIHGLYFPAGTNLVYSCDFKDLPRKPDKLLMAKLFGKMKFENDILSAKSDLYFSEGKLYMIRFGEKQKFRDHTYDVNVSISFNLKSGKLISIFGNPPFQFDDAIYNYINFSPHGDLVSFELAKDAWILNFPIKAKEAIYLVDGIYSRIVLSKPHKIGQWTFEGKLSFFKNGKVELGSLATVHTFEKAKLKGPVQFNESGELIMGTLSENVVRVYDPSTCGTLFMKAGDHVGFGEEGARLWPKWYPEDKPNHCSPPSQEILKKMFPSKAN